jgi:hypothetical protein
LIERHLFGLLLAQTLFAPQIEQATFVHVPGNRALSDVTLLTVWFIYPTACEGIYLQSASLTFSDESQSRAYSDDQPPNMHCAYRQQERLLHGQLMCVVCRIISDTVTHSN